MNKTSRNSSPTLGDIARACGVSKMTVSYVLNGKSTLKPETRERVFKVMREMNYHPSAVARGLATKKVNTFGLLMPVFTSAEFVTDPYAHGVLQGIFWQAEREGYNVTVITSRWVNAEVSASALRDGLTDGLLVVAPPLYTDILSGLTALRLPVVAISSVPTDGVSVVDVDNEAGVRMAVSHLIELGHRHIVYLTGNDDLASFEPRRRAFVAALTEAGIQVTPEMIQNSEFDGRIALEQASVLLKSKRRPSAILAGNDTIAASVLEAARRAGIKVPEQLSVVGFDDLPLATIVSPALTTIHQPLSQIGEKAISLLVERSSRPFDPQGDLHLLAPQLIVRNSSAPPLR